MLPKEKLAIIIGKMKGGDDKKPASEDDEERDERASDDEEEKDDDGAESTMDEFISCVQSGDCEGALKAFKDLITQVG